MKLSIATVSLSGDLNEKLEAVAAAGFKGVEIFEADLLSFDGTPGDVRRRAADLGLDIITFQPFRDFEGMPPELRERNLARAERKFDLMAELGCDLLLVCSNVSPQSLGGIGRAADDLHALGERAAKRGMRVGFEALAWGRHISDYRDSWEAVRRADHPAIGLVLDSFHIFARKTDLKPISSIPRDKIFLVQLADAPLLDMDSLSWSRHFRNFPGQGELPLIDFMAALQATDFDGLLSLEIFNDQFRAGSARSVAIDGRRSLLYLFDQLRERGGTLPAGLVQLPPRAKVPWHRVHRVRDRRERGAGVRDAAARPRLRACRHSQVEGGDALDARRDQHRGERREGRLRPLLQYHPRHRRLRHRPRGRRRGGDACPRRGAARQAVPPGGRAGRARNPRGARPRRQPRLFRRQGERSRPGLGDRVRADRRNATPMPACAAVDHISQSMHYEEMLTWVLFYTSLLDLKKTGEQDVLDPGGLVKSQVVQSADGALRIALNASQSARTQSSRFLTEAFGSGVQHIAFATADLAATVARLEANGVDLLPIPENYYDDLEAKTDLAPERIDALRAHNILYDRDGGAEYLQVYTRTFRERFFFEIVERRGYAGFGAANASIRLAAQTRLARGRMAPAEL